MSINEMFAAANTTGTTTVRSKGLAGTTQLTAVSSELTNNVIKQITDNIEEYSEIFEASKKDANTMDKLLGQLINFSEVDVAFLKELDETVLDGMLKSQQSKRSRAKGKTMTLDNYKNMMTGAIAENLIRTATGKPKSAGGARRVSGSIDFTAEQLSELKDDQEQLRKEIRNVQSKKSIMKSKAAFSEEDERWKKLLVAEEQLKSIRVTTTRAKVMKVDETKQKLSKMMGNVDTSHLKAADAKDMLVQIKELLGDKNNDEPTEDTSAEKPAEDTPVDDTPADEK